jgi:hypothetical protein
MVTEFTNGVVIQYFVPAIKCKSGMSSCSAVVCCENLCHFCSLRDTAILSNKLFYCQMILSVLILSPVTLTKLWDSNSQPVGREHLTSVPASL